MPSAKFGAQPATRITSVCVSPTEPSILVALENERLHLWDVTQVRPVPLHPPLCFAHLCGPQHGQPLVSERASGGFAWAAAWNSTGQEFFVGGHSGTLKLFDRRLLGSRALSPCVCVCVPGR
jgi:WD40 repeat protein